MSDLNGQILCGDAYEHLRAMESDSVDALITDPPYGLGMVSKDWDRAVPSVAVWMEALRVLRAGAIGAIFSSSRSDISSKTVRNLQLAGFDVRFSPIYWAHENMCMNKGHDISRDIDCLRGAERSVVGYRTGITVDRARAGRGGNSLYASGVPKRLIRIPITVPACGEAKRFDGYYSGYQPRPVVEPIVVVQKPLSVRTYALQALDNGLGGTWLGKCRIGTKVPANLVASGSVLGAKYDLGCWWNDRIRALPPEVQETFPAVFVPKPSKSERNAGLEVGCDGGPSTNTHETVKPVTLMRYLVCLLTSAGQLVLDPFSGSGTTLMAAKGLGREYVGIEREREYVEIAEARLTGVRWAEYLSPLNGENENDETVA